MSKQALEWVSENLPTVRRAKFTDSSGKVRPIGENGLALLWYLCDRTNSAGCFFMQARTMADETDLHLSAVKRLLAGFEQLGWVTRTGELVSYEGRGTPTPEYSLTLVPGLTKKATATRTGIPTGHPTGSPRDTSSETKPNNGAETSFSDYLQPEPQPQTEPHHEPTRPQVATGQEGGKEWGERHARLLPQCIERERDRTPKGVGAGLRQKLEREYRPIITQVLRDRPGQTDTELVRVCVAQRNGEKVRPPAPRTNPDCEQCRGKGWYSGDYDHETNSATRVTCLCAGQDATHTETQTDTRERVSTDRGTNTDSPTPSATADPQLGHAVTGLTDRLRRVV